MPKIVDGEVQLTDEEEDKLRLMIKERLEDKYLLIIEEILAEMVINGEAVRRACRRNEPQYLRAFQHWRG